MCNKGYLHTLLLKLISIQKQITFTFFGFPFLLTVVLADFTQKFKNYFKNLLTKFKVLCLDDQKCYLAVKY